MKFFKSGKAFLKKKDYPKIPEDVRMNIIERACKQVSRGVFFFNHYHHCFFLTCIYAYRSGGEVVWSLSLYKDVHNDC